METRGNVIAIEFLSLMWQCSNAIFHRPQNYQELSNLHHASAHNTVEHIFGVFKHEFSLFKIAPEYPMNTQAMFIPESSSQCSSQLH